MCLLAMALCIPATWWVEYDRSSAVAGSARETSSSHTRGAAGIPAPEPAGLQELKRLESERKEELRRIQQEIRARELELERRIRYAEERFKEDGGRNSDRGAVYIEYGPPAEIETYGNG